VSFHGYIEKTYFQLFNSPYIKLQSERNTSAIVTDSLLSRFDDDGQQELPRKR